MADMERRAWRVRGHVQGVGFRWSAARTADELGVGGTVRNLRDGSVEVHACGPSEVLDRFEAWLRAGPPSASVEALDPIEPSAGMREGEFRILR